ncbi:hypothetical protein DMN91_000748 [Ooceraea biroi]|uniref:Vesicular glutamate transporter n=1 Tax=Ooceraea biroi TaxID=2015173 RepID=A0A3L8E3Z5_OOCBI|nr:hypothetical protein DMN91_000748 [Ooceraea biroi]
MSGFAAAGLVAFDSFKTKASLKLSGFRRSNVGGYEEFETEDSKDNKGFEDEKGYSRGASFESLPEPERPPLRHIDTYCMPECFIISFGMRCNMGMAKLVIKNTTTQGENNTEHSFKYNWTIGVESALDSSFFWGYLVTQVPGGFLASLYPANKIFGTAIAISSFLNLLVPGALKVHPVVDMCVQVLKGLVEGVTYPACHGIWKYWAPPLERSRLATLAFCGSYAAMVIGMPLSGYLSSWFGWTASFYFYGLLADYLRKRGIMSTTTVRKLFNCGGFGMEALFFLVVASATTSKNGAAATFALAIGVACSGFAISGFNVNHLDIAPRYASILMGMSNGIGTIAGLLVPFFVDTITEKKDPYSWRNVFIIAACVHIFGVTFYAIFCSGELQPWADPTLEEQKTWNPMDEFGQTKPPVPPPPKTMQSEFIKQPSRDESVTDNWNTYEQSTPEGHLYQDNKASVISYGSMETNSNNPFHSTNPFATDISASYVQPSATDDYTHDIMHRQQ